MHNAIVDSGILDSVFIIGDGTSLNDDDVKRSGVACQELLYGTVAC